MSAEIYFIGEGDSGHKELFRALTDPDYKFGGSIINSTFDEQEVVDNIFYATGFNPGCSYDSTLLVCVNLTRTLDTESILGRAKDLRQTLNRKKNDEPRIIVVGIGNTADNTFLNNSKQIKQLVENERFEFLEITLKNPDTISQLKNEIFKPATTKNLDYDVEQHESYIDIEQHKSDSDIEQLESYSDLELDTPTSKKVQIVGDHNSGKSELFNALTLNSYKYKEQKEPTEFAKNVIRDGFNYQIKPISASEERYDESSTVIYCVDLSKEIDYELIGDDLNSIRTFSKIKIIIVGTNANKDEDYSNLNRFASEYNCGFQLTNVKDEKLGIQDLKRKINPTDNALSVKDKSFTKAPTPINSPKATPFKLIDYINSINSNEDFKNSLLKLNSYLDKNPNKKIKDATIQMIKGYKGLVSTDQKAIEKLFNTYEKACSDSMTKTALKLVGACIVTGIFALLGIAIGGTLGTVAGILAGAITGPGGIVTGVAGLATGTVTGWTLGIAAAAAVTGISLGAVGGGLTGMRLFKPKPEIVDVINTGKSSLLNSGK